MDNFHEAALGSHNIRILLIGDSPFITEEHFKILEKFQVDALASGKFYKLLENHDFTLTDFLKFTQKQLKALKVGELFSLVFDYAGGIGLNKFLGLTELQLELLHLFCSHQILSCDIIPDFGGFVGEGISKRLLTSSLCDEDYEASLPRFFSSEHIDIKYKTRVALILSDAYPENERVSKILSSFSRKIYPRFPKMAKFISHGFKDLDTKLSTTMGIEVEYLGLDFDESYILQALIDYIQPGWSHPGDYSIDTEECMVGEESVTPILASVEDLNKAQAVIQLIRLFGKVNRSCGLHIHLGVNNYVSDNIPAEKQEAYKLELCRQFVLLYYSMQGGFKDVVRGPNSYCNNPFDCYIGSREECTNMITRASSLKELREVANPGMGRDWQVNLQSLSRLGTIEIRQHQGSVIREEITSWASLMQRMFAQAIRRADRICRIGIPDIEDLATSLSELHVRSPKALEVSSRKYTNWRERAEDSIQRRSELTIAQRSSFR